MALRSLVIALDLPLPVSGGGDLRTLGIVQALGALGPVALFGIHPREPRPSPIAGLAAWRSSSDAALADPRAQARAALTWMRTADGHPCDRWWSDLAAGELARLADELDAQLVVVEGLWVHRYGEAIRAPGRRLVLDAHNAEAALAEDLAGAGEQDPHRAAWATRIAERVASRELAAVASADRTWAPSARDAAALAAPHRAGSVRVDVVPSAIAARAYGGPGGDRGPVIVYPASFGYPPNEDAARRLASGVLPAVREAVPGATLLLVGAQLPRELAATPGVEAPGRVDDMLPYLRRASVMAVALRHGGGTRLKVLEAFAAGVAIVSTRKGIEGLDVRDGVHVLLAESDAQLAAAVLRVWADESLRTHLTTCAAALVRDRYGPDAIAVAVRRALPAGLSADGGEPASAPARQPPHPAP